MLAYYVGFGLSMIAFCAYDTYKIIKKLDEVRDLKKQLED